MGLKLEEAQKIVAGALAYARKNNLKPMGFVVLDERGALRAAAAEDGTSVARWRVAYGKANGALGMGVSSRKLQEMAVDRPHFMAALPSVMPEGLVPVPGGVLIRDADGAVIGAAGAPGDTSDNDEAAVVAGIADAGLKCQLG
jgi:uncharacterized protein GlcG (DUF336 family)